MPVPALKSMASKHGISKDRAEHIWNKAKEIASKEYKYGKKSPNHWALVTGITKKMMGENKSLTFKEFIALIEEVKKTSDEKPEDVPAFFKKQAGPPLSALDKLKIKMKLALGHKPALLKKQAESYE